MSLKRDGMSNKAVITQSLALLKASEGAGYNVAGTPINTQGFTKMTVSLNPSRAITGTDNILFAPLEKADNGGGGSAIAQDKLLPTYKKDLDAFKLTAQNSPYDQVFGITQALQWVEINLNGIFLDTADVTLEVTIILEAEIHEFDGADPDFPSLDE